MSTAPRRAPRATQLKLGVQPGRRTTRVYKKESQVQREVEVQLRMMGYKVWSTVHRYKMQCCPQCGHHFRPKGGYGASLGIADLLVRGTGRGESTRWPRALCLQVELKGEKTPLSEVQKIEQDEGEIIVVRSAEQAVNVVRSFERFLKRHSVGSAE
jgi:hypothetical protein